MVENIKRICAERGMTVQQLEERANVAAGTVGRWGKDGKFTPAVDKVKRVADALGVTVDELLREEAADAAH